MTSETGVKPPLHQRFDEQVAIRHIRNRYGEIRKAISRQVDVLRKENVFRQKCQGYYQSGYKDWVIVGAILNCMLNWKARDLGIDLPSEGAKQQFIELRNILSDVVYPTERFLGGDLDMHIKAHSLYALNSYGFEMRRKDFKPEVVEKFMRERMRHFDFDLSHRPLFGEPPGDWPNI